MEKGTERELERFERQQRRVEAMLELPAEQLLARRADRSGWSAAEHLFHVSLANELSLKNVSALVARKGVLIRPREELDPRAAGVLRSGRFPPGAEAPRFVRPPAVVDLDLAREMAAGVRASLAELRARGGIDDAPDGIPHQALGVLSAAQWVRFVHMHTAHHLRIARAVLA